MLGIRFKAGKFCCMPICRGELLTPERLQGDYCMSKQKCVEIKTLVRDESPDSDLGSGTK